MTGGQPARAVPEHVDDGSRVPYRRWRRWQRSLRRRAALTRLVESGGDPHDRIYLAYGVVLLALVYGPILWSALAQASAAALPALAGPSGAGAGIVAAVVLFALGLACAAGLVAARAGGPLWVSPPEAAFVLSGQFRARAVLWRRGTALIVGAAVLGAFAATAVAHGAGAAPQAVAAGGAGAVLLAQVPIAVGAAAQGPRWRWAARGVTSAFLLLGAGAALVAAGGTVPAAGWSVVRPVAVLVVVLALWCVWLVVRALPEHVDVDVAAAGHRRTSAAGRGLAGGDAGGVADVLGPQTFAGRRATLPGVVLARLPVVARDLLGLRRRPIALAGSVVAGVLGALLTVAAAVVVEGGALAAVVGALVLYPASASWCAGLRAMAAQPEPGALLPGSVRRVIGAHAAVPVAVAAVVAGLAALVAGTLGAAPVAASGLVAAVLAVVLATRLWVAGATAAPPGMFTPMMTPAGDASMLVLGAWYLRGWLVVGTTAWLVQRSVAAGGTGLAVEDLVAPCVVAAATAAMLAWAALRRFARA